MLETTERSYAGTMNRDEPKEGAKEGELRPVASVPAAARPAPVLQASPQGVRVPRRETREGIDPMSEAAGIQWEKRSASITANASTLLKPSAATFSCALRSIGSDRSTPTSRLLRA